MRPLLAVLLLSAPAAAQFDADPAAALRARSFADVAEVTAKIEPAQAKPGQVVNFVLTVTPKPGCWTYPATAKQSSKNVIKLPADGDVVFVEPVADPLGAHTKPAADGGTDLYYPDPAVWTFKAVVKPTAAAGKRTVTLTGTRIQACNEQNCFYARNPPSAEVEILPGPPEVPAAAAQPVGRNVQAPAAVPPPPAPEAAKSAEPTGLVRKTAVAPEAHAASLEALRAKLVNDANLLPSNSTWALLLTAAVWGWVSLATPCVFPMIPITVSLFLKQGHKEPRQVLQLAAVYSLTIVAVLGIAAFFLLSVFRKLSVDPYMNLFLGGLFVVFALSLFGWYDITLPGFLLRGAEKRRGAGGLVGTVFGALAFSIVAFTCVAPFLGGFAGMAASGQFSDLQLAAAAVAFAAAFASPFFLLALFPSLLKRLPRSGGWLDTVKAVMGFLELAAAFKFFRTAELRLLPRAEYFTYDVSLAGMIVVSVAAGLYLLGLFRLPHDDEDRSQLGVPRLMFALAFLGLGLHLMPGLWGHRPRGVTYAWVDAFLLPEPADPGKGLPWNSDLMAAIERARTEQKLVFVDFTGKTCQNCKLNEDNVFPQPAVDALLRRYVLASMYTDEVLVEFYAPPPTDDTRTAEAMANLQFQKAVFGTEQLPLYAILEPLADGRVRVVGVYDEGKINDVPRFVEFLRKPLDKK